MRHINELVNQDILESKLLQFSIDWGIPNFKQLSKHLGGKVWNTEFKFCLKQLWFSNARSNFICYLELLKLSILFLGVNINDKSHHFKCFKEVWKIFSILFFVLRFINLHHWLKKLPVIAVFILVEQIIGIGFKSRLNTEFYILTVTHAGT